jgi:hypothetical protein
MLVYGQLWGLQMSINKKIEHTIENVNKTNDERTKTNIICKQSATKNVITANEHRIRWSGDSNTKGLLPQE